VHDLVEFFAGLAEFYDAGFHAVEGEIGDAPAEGQRYEG